MKKRKIWRKGLAAVLVAAMAFGIPVAASPETAEAAEITLPDPAFFYDFEGDDENTQLSNKGTVKGTEESPIANASIVNAENGAIKTEGDGNHYFDNGSEKELAAWDARDNNGLSLPREIIDTIHTSSTDAFTVSMKVKPVAGKYSEYSPLITMDSAASKLSYPCLAIELRGTAAWNAAGYYNGDNLYANTWKDKYGSASEGWHTYTFVMAGKTMKGYWDGQLVNTTELTGTGNGEGSNEGIFHETDHFITGIDRVILGGDQLFTWADPDAQILFDDVAIYAEGLSADQVYKLVTGGDPVNTDKSALSTAIDAAKKIGGIEFYTAETAGAFTEALTVAEEVFNNAAATQEEVTAAATALTTATNNLVQCTTNLKDGLVFAYDDDSAESQVDTEKNTVTVNGYSVAANGTTTLDEDGYFVSAKDGIEIDKKILDGVTADKGLTISSKIALTAECTSDWKDLLTMTDSSNTGILRATFGFITFTSALGTENLFPGSNCKNGFAWDSCKSYPVDIEKEYTITMDSTGLKHYVDGVLAFSTTAADGAKLDFGSVFKKAEHIRVGNYVVSATDAIESSIHGVTVYNRSLNAAEVKELCEQKLVSAKVNVVKGSVVSVKKDDTDICSATADENGVARLKGLTPGETYTYTVELPAAYAFKTDSDQTGSITATADDTDDKTIETVEKKLSITPEQTEILNENGKTVTIEVSEAVPEDTTITEAVSDAPAIATVAVNAGKAVVTPVSAGQAVITVTGSNGLTAECTVTVKDPVPITAVTLDKETLTLKNTKDKDTGAIYYGTYTLQASVVPENTTDDKTIMYKSSDDTVATVDGKGVITAVAESGEVTITATSSNGKTAECKVTVETDEVEIIPVTAVALDKTEEEIEIGGTLTLTATITPEDATIQTCSWGSSDDTIASVENGVVTGHKEGTATITVTTTDGQKTASCTVTVKAPVVHVSGVELNKTSVQLVVGGTEELTATVTPADATDKSVTWKSSDDTVATVENGTVTAVAAGTATITVTTTDGEKTAECTVTVKADDSGNTDPVAVTGVTLDKSTAELTVGGSLVLTATVTPDDATDKSVTWKSSDDKIATVKDGTVTAVAAGTATITVMTKDGEKTAECKVTVKEAETGGDNNNTNNNNNNNNNNNTTNTDNNTPGTDSGSTDKKTEDTLAAKAETKKNVTAAKTNGVTVKVDTDKNGTAAISTLGKTNKKSVTVASKVKVGNVSYTVTVIKAKAFANCKKATKITLPSTIKKINKNAFTGTKKLKTIVIKGKKSITIKKGAFKGINTKKVTIKVNKKISKKEFKKLKKNLKKAGFKGKIKKG